MQNDFTMDNSLLRRFVREIILQTDTPSLILELAGNCRYLMLCREIVNSYKSVNPNFFNLLNTVCAEHAIEPEWLKKRLVPAAKALGLQLERRYQLDYYAVLGIEQDANYLEIKQAFRKKAYLSHPDTKKTGSDERYAFTEISDAYRTLSNENLRHHYDLSRQSLSQWHETPGPILKVTKSKKTIMVQLACLMLVLSVFVFLFDIIFHGESKRKRYAQPKLSLTYKPEQIQELQNEFHDLSLINKKEIKPRLFPTTIPSSADKITDGGDLQQNDLKDSLSIPNKGIVPAIESDNYVNIAAPNAATDEEITIKENTATDEGNQQLVNNKIDQIYIAIHEESKPASASLKGFVTPKSEHLKKRHKNSSQTIVSVVKHNSYNASRTTGDEVITFTAELPQSPELASSIAIMLGEEIEIEMDVKKRLEQFLNIYCRTYEEKNIYKFVNFFTDTAQENGKAFSSLISVYNENFSSIDEIKYKIKIFKYSYDLFSGTVSFEGKFFLEWLPKGDNWHWNFGKIGMKLIEKNDSFLVEHLNYSGS